LRACLWCELILLCRLRREQVQLAAEPDPSTPPVMRISSVAIAAHWELTVVVVVVAAEVAAPNKPIGGADPGGPRTSAGIEVELVIVAFRIPRNPRAPAESVRSDCFCTPGPAPGGPQNGRPLPLLLRKRPDDPREARDQMAKLAIRSSMRAPSARAARSCVGSLASVRNLGRHVAGFATPQRTRGDSGTGGKTRDVRMFRKNRWPCVTIPTAASGPCRIR
jgi:hypothetical protein